MNANTSALSSTAGKGKKMKQFWFVYPEGSGYVGDRCETLEEAAEKCADRARENIGSRYYVLEAVMTSIVKEIPVTTERLRDSATSTYRYVASSSPVERDRI